MPGCAAVGCRNSDRKGFSMRRFPSDPKRRTEWLLEMKRGKWTPTEFSRLCEAHFAPEMWEQHRMDGKKRLKMNAVPRLFAFTKFEEYWKPPAEIFSERKPTSLGMDIHNDPTSGGFCMSAPELQNHQIKMEIDIKTEKDIKTEIGITTEIDIKTEIDI